MPGALAAGSLGLSWQGRLRPDAEGAGLVWQLVLAQTLRVS